MSDFIKKVKDEAKAVSAAIDQELTVLEGVDGYDPLRGDDESPTDAAAPTDASTEDAEPSSADPTDAGRGDKS
ncbi:Mbre_bop1; block of proliferation 1 [Gordonia bronchialis DSM 43247]|jgi:hypothetical protein|uniref:Mbre_bop1 block of proliferation 1 n=1 Tax=Gordonia bronchialis (strain ATCC 25592 / DSM 43247 / BCRC 13721 / JCM 3198 / KCTC 3076 / NBRC 16047 / NCTC 10667) TaxID=526226 RepID=D0LEJ0_GORB4|nr:hypothetical protein [Gordonia bronchialis]ACY19908.1 Mbre_bop1; block of proliferation 1 [Gordonia bronchialis DSM 43247]MCC3322682.1 hypothetical protein [Gordonia bronchialis]QGS26227.1 hypothetical protein FOB84_20935 [Gordonia bronchialis]UAK37386.1 hypothetical protein K8O93_20005 [Gordonia bronchialis]STQ62686.1 Uncharacterised protein [Gordonia bronchialis]